MVLQAKNSLTISFLFFAFFSSAKDQIGQQTVAVKKLSEPFKTDNIAKHMYREVKLLKQLQHENVCHHSLLGH